MSISFHLTPETFDSQHLYWQENDQEGKSKEDGKDYICKQLIPKYQYNQKPPKKPLEKTKNEFHNSNLRFVGPIHRLQRPASRPKPGFGWAIGYQYDMTVPAEKAWVDGMRKIHLELCKACIKYFKIDSAPGVFQWELKSPIAKVVKKFNAETEKYEAGECEVSWFNLVTGKKFGNTVFKALTCDASQVKWDDPRDIESKTTELSTEDWQDCILKYPIHFVPILTIDRCVSTSGKYKVLTSTAEVIIVGMGEEQQQISRTGSALSTIAASLKDGISSEANANMLAFLQRAAAKRQAEADAKKTDAGDATTATAESKKRDRDEADTTDAAKKEAETATLVASAATTTLAQDDDLKQYSDISVADL